MSLTVKLLLLSVCLFFTASCGHEQKKDEKKSGQDPVLNTAEATRFRLLLADLEELKGDDLLKNATLGYFIIDITKQNNKTVVAQFEPTRQMMPASTLKLFVTAPALEIFGPPIIPRSHYNEPA